MQTLDTQRSLVTIEPLHFLTNLKSGSRPAFLFLQMSSEILAILEYMEKEKGISREDMIATIANAIRTAAHKGLHAGQEVKVDIDRRTGSLKAWAILRVVDSVSDQEQEIHLEQARKLKPDAALGEILEKPIDPSYLGRIAAQAAKQAIVQRIREFEKERIFDDYKDSVGDIVSGTVHRREKSDLIIELDNKTEAVLPRRERIPRENFGPGDRIRALLLKIESGTRGPNIILSRSSLRFVERLLELEVTEISDGTVVIERMAREPGYRTKICVRSTDSKVDPVGACVGARGSRVKSIVRELGGEKVDIMRWFDDASQMLEEALKPAVPRNVQIDETARRIHFEVDEEDLSLTIGKGGFNARLTSQLMGWKLHIGRYGQKDIGLDAQIEAAIQNLVETTGLSPEISQRLVTAGLTSLAVFEGVASDDLIDLGFSEEEAVEILEHISKAQAS